VTQLSLQLKILPLSHHSQEILAGVFNVYLLTLSFTVKGCFDIKVINMFNGQTRYIFATIRKSDKTTLFSPSYFYSLLAYSNTFIQTFTLTFILSFTRHSFIQQTNVADGRQIADKE
jgi:hypothetical protein